MARQRPLVEGIDEVKIRQAVPLGEEVTILMDLDTEKSGFVANAIVKKEDGSTAQVITGMKGLVGDRDRIDRLIGLKLTRLAAKR